MLVCWLFFNFSTSFDFWCCSLPQRWVLWTAMCPISGSGLSQKWVDHSLLVLLPFQSLFTESSCRDQLLALPPSPVQSENPIPCAMGSFQFLVLYSVLFFCRVGVNLSRSTVCCLFAHLLVCVYQACLEPVSGFTTPAVSVKHGMEKLCAGWEFRVLEFCFFLVVFFCQVWLQSLSKIFDLWSSCCLHPPSSCHLGSSIVTFYFVITVPS
jgi:hypothetical protein